jgi:hypothetical protein
VPKGLRLKKKACLGELSNEFNTEWQGILNNVEMRIVDLLNREVAKSKMVWRTQFEAEWQKLKQRNSADYMEEVHQYIEQESRCWERSLTRRREGKWRILKETQGRPRLTKQTMENLGGIIREVEVFNENRESQLSQGRRENSSEDAEDIQSVQNQRLELAIEDELLDCNEAEQSRVRSDVNQVFVSENVVNLSTRNLSHAEVKVLSKGLNFCPTAKEIDKHKLAQDLAEFSRKMKCRAYFYR